MELGKLINDVQYIAEHRPTSISAIGYLIFKLDKEIILALILNIVKLHSPYSQLLVYKVRLAKLQFGTYYIFLLFCIILVYGSMYSIWLHELFRYILYILSVYGFNLSENNIGTRS